MRSCIPVLLIALSLVISVFASPAKAEETITREPSIISRATPVYPPEAHAQKREGSVWVRYRVAPDGRVSDAKVEKSTDSAFNQAAMSAMLKCRFKPARTASGKAVERWGVQEVQFRMKDAHPLKRKSSPKKKIIID